MHLDSPQSAILSAVIFNALVIVALIPLALRGVRFRPASAAAMLRRNLLIYGAGGVILPFVGINVVENVEWRAGSFFEPATGERFELVTSNPPYVISPESAFLFRDSGLEGDSVSRLVVGASGLV